VSGVSVRVSSAPGGSAVTSRRRLLALISVHVAATVTLGPGSEQTVHAASQAEPALPSAPTHEAAVALAFEQRQRAITWGDQPFGAILLRQGIVVGEGPSRVILHGDPTAHAEMEAIRDACRRLGTRDLSGCELYATSRPCQMCDAALGWARVSRVYYGSDGADAGAPGLGRC